MNLDRRLMLLDARDSMLVVLNGLLWSAIMTAISFGIELITLVGFRLLHKAVFHVLMFVNDDNLGDSDYSFIHDLTIIKGHDDVLVPVLFIVALLFAIIGFFVGLNRAGDSK